MDGHGPARPGTRNRPQGGMLQDGKHQKGEKWERVPARSAWLLRLFFALVVLSIAAGTVVIIHLRAQPSVRGRQGASARAASRSSEARSLSAVVALARPNRFSSVSLVQS
jgi:hypothetical protein